MGAVDWLERDLLDCGVPYAEVERLTTRYVRALETNSHIDWIELYVGVFATLRRSLDYTRSADPSALERVLQLINDDLGSELFSPEARAELASASRTNFADALS
jgi:hypothetical protein